MMLSNFFVNKANERLIFCKFKEKKINHCFIILSVLLSLSIVTLQEICTRLDNFHLNPRARWNYSMICYLSMSVMMNFPSIYGWMQCVHESQDANMHHSLVLCLNYCYEICQKTECFCFEFEI